MKKNKPLVSAIITTYKRDYRIVKRAIDSVLNQDYSNIELIIVNDYPENCKNNIKLEKMIKEYNRNINYIVVDKNGGACKARNIGIKESKGQYIAFLDDDDEWLPTKITHMIEEITKNQNIAIVYSNSIIYNDDIKEEKIRFNTPRPSGYIYYELLKENIIGSCSFPLIKKAILEKVNGFKEEMPALQDWELYLRITKKYEVKYIQKALTKYYIYNGDRISKSSNRRVDAMNKIYDEFKDDITNDFSVAHEFYLNFSRILSDNNNHIEAFKYIRKAICKQPTKIVRNVKELIRAFLRIFYKKSNL